jgi:hypothetical protein
MEIKSVFSLLLFVFSSHAGHAVGNDLGYIKTCMEFCKTGNSECFDLGPAFKPAPLPLADIAMTATMPDGGSKVLCENREVVQTSGTINSEGPICLIKSKFAPSSLTIPDVLRGTITSNDELNHVVVFETDKAPSWLGGLPEAPSLDGKVKFIAMSGKLVIFGLQGQNVQTCFGFFIP